MSFADQVTAVRDVLERHGMTDVPIALLLDLAKSVPTYSEYWTDEQVAAYLSMDRAWSARRWVNRHGIPRVPMAPAEAVRVWADKEATQTTS